MSEVQERLLGQTKEELRHERYREKARQWRLSHPDRVKFHNQTNYQKHRLKRIADGKEYRQKNSAKIRTAGLIYRQKNAERLREKRRNRTPEEKARRAAKQRIYHAGKIQSEGQSYHDHVNELSRKSYAKHKERLWPKQRDTRQTLRREVIEAYGGFCCKCCGETTPEFLGIDHINGGGWKHRNELKKAGHSFYRWLKTQGFPPGFQVLCHNCNQAKGYYGSCPHQRQSNKPT